jgi:hypothetical protein
MSANYNSVWNRACSGGGDKPREGDAALAALLTFHGAAMYGGVLHALESLSADELQAAIRGYRYYGLSEVVDFLPKAAHLAATATESEMDNLEGRLDSEYHGHIPRDDVLVKRFEEHLSAHPEAFAPEK